MKRLARLLAFALVVPGPAGAADPPALAAKGGMVAADNALASQVGADMLAAGGDAVDAAVATALMLGVVQPFASGLGGGLFAVVWRADGEQGFALDSREVAPAGATRDMYLDAQGEVDHQRSTRGPLAAAVPGEIAGLWQLHQRHGKLPWKQVVAPALKAARDGFRVGALLHERVTAKKKEIAERPALAAVFFVDGQPIREGALLKRPGLAKTLAAISKQGADGFYKGDVAKRLAAAVAKDGGLITEADLAAYAPKQRALVDAAWRGYRVLSRPPPSSGGAVLVQVLRALEHLDLKALGHNSSAYLHRLAEALKHAFADRARLMGDPDFAPVPLDQMVGDAARDRLRATFDPARTHERAAYGGDYDLPGDGGTSHFSVVDAAGNAVAITSTVNLAFGSMYLAGDTGVLLNNEMDDFVAKPGVPNAFGLVGREANTIAPGKRPLSSMTPTIVLKDARVALVVGASGGPRIITGTLQVLLNVLAFEMDPRAAVEAPRVHHQWVPEVLAVEPEIALDVRENLQRRGHDVQAQGRYNAVQVIAVDAAGVARGASDPSKLGAPAAAKP
jgi:gamma-glutamyltranspeptidase/glutathione hydrolase